MKICLHTLGCSKNTVDSEHVAAALSARHEITESGPADVFLLNTCSFIADAKTESIDAILEAARLKETGFYKKIVVFGCLPQRYAAQMLELIPEVDAWFGARDFTPLLEYFSISSGISESGRYSFTDVPYSYLKISEGCNRHCSYCAIPLIRGRHHSVPEEELVEEARVLASKGTKELIVIAQDSTAYGLDLYHKRSLGRLLDNLSLIDGIHRIRLHYSYPLGFPEDVIEQIAHNPKICKYIDIPLQHVSDKVLSAMRRGIDSKGTRLLVDKFRKEIPGVVLRTTLMVGHPGEGKREFDELMQFIKDARFERMGAFAYSEEDDTYGKRHLKDSVSEKVKQERLSLLMEAQQQISYEYNVSRVGKTEEVLVDRYEDSILVCRSDGESPDVDGEILIKETSVKKGAALVGKFIKAEITAADAYDLTARIHKSEHS